MCLCVYCLCVLSVSMYTREERYVWCLISNKVGGVMCVCLVEHLATD